MRGCIDAAVNYLYPVDQSNLVPILSQTALAIRSRVASTIICMANGLGVSGHQQILHLLGWQVLYDEEGAQHSCIEGIRVFIVRDPWGRSL